MKKNVFIIVIASMLVLSACGKEETVAEPQPQVEIEETVEEETEPEVVEETAEEETEPEIVEETAEEETKPEVVEETVEEETEPGIVEETAEQQAKESAKEEAPSNENKEVVNSGSDASVPVTKEVAQEQQAQQTVEQPQPTPEATTPAPQEELVDGMTLEERQALADKMNAEHAKITDPNDPRYGVTYSVGKVHGSFR